MTKPNCTYGSYEEWIDMVVSDGRFTASEIGVIVIAVHFKDASNVELTKTGRVSKSTVVSAKSKLREFGFVEISIGGAGQGNRTIIAPKFPDGRVFKSIHETDLSGTEGYQKDVSGTKRYHIIPHNTANPYQNVPLNTTKSGVSGTEGYHKTPENGFSGTNGYHKAERVESGPYIDNNITPPTPPPSWEGGKPNSDWKPKNIWGEILNPSMHGEASGVSFNGENIQLENGVRQKWLQKFGSEERLELALTEASGRIRPASSRPLKIQVEAILASKIAQKMDQDHRYDTAVKTNQKTGKKSEKSEIKAIMEG